jgi:phosphoglycolate phosphatase-like HAD superfamily hydrolase
MDKTFIFDLDDTLIKNHHKYCYVQMEFAKWVFERLGPRAPDLQELLTLQTNIDVKLVSTGGFSKERFPRSLSEAFRLVSESLGVNDEEGERIAYEIGYGVFNEQRWMQLGIGGLINGASRTLDFLSDQKDELMLLTKGDESVQREKIRVYGLKRWFGEISDGRISIVDRKSAQVIKNMVGTRDKSKIWHVGNLIKSDVRPGLDAEVNVIYVPCETWAYEKINEGLPQSDKLRVVTNISEIISIYPTL